MLLAGIGNVDAHQKRNYFIVDGSKVSSSSIILTFAETSTEAIEEIFKDFTTRKDIAILLINQFVRFTFFPSFNLSGCKPNSRAGGRVPRNAPYYSGNSKQRSPVESRTRFSLA